MQNVSSISVLIASFHIDVPAWLITEVFLTLLVFLSDTWGNTDNWNHTLNFVSFFCEEIHRLSFPYCLGKIDTTDIIIIIIIISLSLFWTWTPLTYWHGLPDDVLA